MAKKKKKQSKNKHYRYRKKIKINTESPSETMLEKKINLHCFYKHKLKKISSKKLVLHEMFFRLKKNNISGNSDLRDNPLQYSCLENPMDRRAWWATVHGVAKSWTRLKRLSTHAHKGTECWKL